jgi:hypothetical protein
MQTCILSDFSFFYILIIRNLAIRRNHPGYSVVSELISINNLSAVADLTRLLPAGINEYLNRGNTSFNWRVA